jgi:hypothetical protein
MSINSLVEILEIVKYTKQNGDLLWGFNIENPTETYTTDKYEMLVSGWVLGKKSQVLGVEIISDGLLLQYIPVEDDRPDVFRRFPEAESTNTPGFSSTISVDQMPTENELVVQAVFSDHHRLLLGSIKFRRNLPFLERVQKDLEENSLKLMEFQKCLENYNVTSGT